MLSMFLRSVPGGDKTGELVVEPTRPSPSAR